MAVVFRFTDAIPQPSQAGLTMLPTSVLIDTATGLLDCAIVGIKGDGGYIVGTQTYVTIQLTPEDMQAIGAVIFARANALGMVPTPGALGIE
jgi:hypothetical protein